MKVRCILESVNATIESLKGLKDTKMTNNTVFGEKVIRKTID